MKNIIVMSLLLLCYCCSWAQYDSAIRYRMPISFFRAMDTLIVRDSVSTDTAELESSELVRQKYFASSRISFDVTTGADMTAPMGKALSSYMTYYSNYCPGIGYDGNWNCVGPFNSYYGASTTQMQGRIVSLWVDPDDSSTILAGAYYGGLWKSTNDGHSWHNITDASDGMGSGVLGMPGVKCIAVDPLDKNRIYIALGGDDQNKKSIGYHLGIAYTTDGGQHWHSDVAFSDSLHTGGGFTDDVKLGYLPGTQQLYAIYRDQVLMKQDTGGNWKDITPSAIAAGGYWCSDIQFSNLSPVKLLLLVSSRSGTNGLWQYSSVGLGSWTDVELSMPSPYTLNDWEGGEMFTVTAADTAYIELRVRSSGTISDILVKTPINSNHVTLLNSTFPGYNIRQFAVSQGNSSVIYGANYSVGGVGGIFTQSTQTCTDAGGFFPEISSGDHSDGRCLYIWRSYSNPNNDVVYFGCDGGVSKKRMGATHTQSITGDSLAITQFFGFGNTESDENIMAGGTQDDGGFAYIKTNTVPWQNIEGGDGYTSKLMNTVKKGFGEVNSCPGCAPHNMYEIDFSSTSASTLSLGHPADLAVSNINRPQYFDASNNEFVGYSHIWKRPYGASSWSRAFTTDPIDKTDTTFPKSAADFYIDGKNTDNAYILYKDAAMDNNGNSKDPSIDTFGKLYVSQNATSTTPIWANITPSIARTNNINSIAIDPNYTNRIWVAFGNVNDSYVGSSPDTMKKRVWYSNDFGATWTDVSTGLSALPVNKLLYRRGSEDELYAGTDVGVFKWSKQDGRWVCFNGQLPACVVMDMEFNYCASKLRAATFGRGMWETTIGNLFDIELVGDTITGNTTWTTPNIYITGAIVVQPGVTLTITGDTVHMPRNGTIIVEPGGKLVVDHAVITNDCDDCMWYGIEALGNYFAPQTPGNQGWVVIKNGSLVQHARYAVSNCDLWNNPSFTGGGIIQCSGSTFLNNHEAVTFYPYHNYDGAGHLHNNVSYFSQCTFKIDSFHYKGDHMGYPFTHHNYLYGVEGVQYTGCYFLNYDTAHLSIHNGDGIYSLDAGFSVGPYCGSYLACVYAVRSRFAGLLNGIRIMDDGSGYSPTISVDRSDFDTVSVGILNSVANNVSATRNNFVMGHGSPVYDVYAGNFVTCHQNIGIFTQNVAQFRIEENSFVGHSNTTYSDWENIGAAIASTNGANKVYRNTFDSLMNGVLAVGVNHGTTGASGLQMICNTFKYNANDIAVTSDGSTTASQGICWFQGSPAGSAGNTFSGSTNNIVNMTTHNITYFYKTGASGELPNTGGTGTVMTAGTSNGAICTSSFGTGSGPVVLTGLGTAQLAAHTTSFNSHQTTRSTLVNGYNALMDYGNTDSLGTVVKSSTDSVSLYMLLAANAPYLSTTTILNVVAAHKLSTADLTLLLKASPDLLRVDGLMDTLANYYTFSAAQTDSLDSVKLVETTRTKMESYINDEYAGMADEGNIIIMAMKSAIDTSVSNFDTTGAGICLDTASYYYTLDSNSYYAYTDSLDYWLRLQDGLWPYYARAGWYNFIGKTGTTDDIYSTLYGMGLGSDDQTDLDDRYTIWTTIETAQSDGRNVVNLDSAELAPYAADTIPTFTYSTGKQIMYNVILTDNPHGNPTGLPCLYITSPHRQSQGGNTGDSGVTAPIAELTTRGKLTVFPNPSSGVVTFSYDEPNASGALNLTITDVIGGKVLERMITSHTGTVEWDSRGAATGIYIYRLSDAEGNIGVGKILVTR